MSAPVLEAVRVGVDENMRVVRVWDAIVAEIKLAGPAPVAAPKIRRGWCGVLSVADGSVLEKMPEDEQKLKIKLWLPDSVGTHRSSNFSEVLQHVVFPSEAKFLAAMSIVTPAGIIRRCCPPYACAHGLQDVKELVSIKLSYGQNKKVPVVSAERQSIISAVRSRVHSVDAKMDVDSVQLSAFGRALKVQLWLHNEKDVAALVSAEASFQGLLGAVQVHVDAPNSAVLMRCDDCGERGHSATKGCEKKYGGPFAMRAVFKEAIDEIGRLSIVEQLTCPHVAVFTGTFIGIKQPRRCLHLTFKSAEDLLAGGKEFYLLFRSELELCVPMNLTVLERSKACIECGADGHRLEQCPFRKTSSYAGAARPAPAAHFRSVLSGSISPQGQVPLAADVARNLRESWRMRNVCYRFFDTGACWRHDQGRCFFHHKSPAEVLSPTRREKYEPVSSLSDTAAAAPLAVPSRSAASTPVSRAPLNSANPFSSLAIDETENDVGQRAESKDGKETKETKETTETADTEEAKESKETAETMKPSVVSRARATSVEKEAKRAAEQSPPERNASHGSGSAGTSLGARGASSSASSSPSSRRPGASLASQSVQSTTAGALPSVGVSPTSSPNVTGTASVDGRQDGASDVLSLSSGLVTADETRSASSTGAASSASSAGPASSAKSINIPNTEAYRDDHSDKSPPDQSPRSSRPTSPARSRSSARLGERAANPNPNLSGIGVAAGKKPLHAKSSRSAKHNKTRNA